MAAAAQAQAGSPAGSVHSARSLPRAGPLSAAELLATPRRGGMMTRGEIDKVLRIQSLTACPPGGDPFVEDFYYREAQLRRGGPGAPPNAPQKLREGVGKPGGLRGPTKHVDLSGLGRLALSNVRRGRGRWLGGRRAARGQRGPAGAHPAGELRGRATRRRRRRPHARSALRGRGGPRRRGRLGGRRGRRRRGGELAAGRPGGAAGGPARRGLQRPLPAAPGQRGARGGAHLPVDRLRPPRAEAPGTPAVAAAPPAARAPPSPCAARAATSVV